MTRLIPPPDAPTLTLTVYHDRAGFDVLRPEWNLLLQRSAFTSLFLTWEWQTTWWESLGVGQLLIAAFRDSGGELVGLAPLYLVEEPTGRTLHFVGCEEVSDYLDLIIAAGHEEEVYTAFLHFLRSKEAPDWNQASLCNLHESSQTHKRFAELAMQTGLHAAVTQIDVAPYLNLPSSFDEYLAGIDKHQRHEIRRKRNKLERESEQWRWFIIREEQGLAAWMEEFLRLHRLASADKEGFMTPGMAAFFHRAASMAAAQGWLALAFIEINGQLASTMLNFDFAGRIWVYNSGYDPAAYGALSPGIVLTSYLIEDAIGQGRTVFDFLQGNEVYKYRFGASDAAIYRLHLQR